MAVPRYKQTFPELAAGYGTETAVRMHALAHEAVDTLERIVQDCGIECGFGRFGHITPIRNAPDIGRFEADVEWLARHADDRAPRMMDARETALQLGTDFYRGGYFEPRGAGIQPFEYCQGLARTLASRGIGIFCATPVRSWSPHGEGVSLQTDRGRVRARQLIIATNAYTDLTPAGDLLRRRIIPIASALIATAPLSDELRARVLPERRLATDAKRLTNYYRLMPDGRFLFGGRGGASSKASARAYSTLTAEMGKIFPALRGVGIDFEWFGLVGVTLDSLPHIGVIVPKVAYAIGYNGRGVALSALLGRSLARVASGESVDLGPISRAGFNEIPFHSLRVPAKKIAIAYMQLRDAIGL